MGKRSDIDAKVVFFWFIGDKGDTGSEGPPGLKGRPGE